MLLTAATLAACGSNEDNAETISLSVESQKVICEGLSQQLCLSVSGHNDLTAFFPFYEDISGFTFQWGHTYFLTVEKTKIDNPPADGSDRHYKLISIDSKIADTIGTQYRYTEVALEHHTFTESEQSYAFLGQPFTCPQPADCDALLSLSDSGGTLYELIFSYTGDGQIQLESWL